jgi:hypothetical protein
VTAEIALHPNNVNKEDGLGISKSWKPRICPLEDHKEPPSWDSWAWVSTGSCSPGNHQPLSLPFLAWLPISWYVSVPAYMTSDCLPSTFTTSLSCSHVWKSQKQLFSWPGVVSFVSYWFVLFLRRASESRLVGLQLPSWPLLVLSFLYMVYCACCLLHFGSLLVLHFCLEDTGNIPFKMLTDFNWTAPRR